MQAIIVLGHRLRDDCHPTSELLKRLDLGVEIFKKFNADKLILSGGMANPKAGITEAEVMREHAISNGIPPQKLILEKESLDTTGNAFFTKELIKGKLDKLCLVTSCYHMPRASFIFKMVFGEGYDWNFDYCAHTETERRFEKVKFDQAKEFFKGMEPDNDIELKRRILRQKLYKDRRFLFHVAKGIKGV